MGHLQRLVQQKKDREAYESDVDRMKVAVVQIESLVSLHDGEFLTELEELLIKWKNKET